MVDKIMHIYSQDWLNQNQVRKATGKIMLGGISKLKAYKLTEKTAMAFKIYCAGLLVLCENALKELHKDNDKALFDLSPKIHMGYFGKGVYNAYYCKRPISEVVRDECKRKLKHIIEELKEIIK